MATPTILARIHIYHESAKSLLALASRHPSSEGPFECGPSYSRSTGASATSEEWIRSLHAQLDSVASLDIVSSLVRRRDVEATFINLYRSCPLLAADDQAAEWRPDISETVNAVLDVISSQESRHSLMDLSPADASTIIDLLYEIMNDQCRLSIAAKLANRISDRLRKLCAKFECLPRACIVSSGSLTIDGDSAVDCGGYSDVWQAQYHPEPGLSKTVALKVFRVYAKDKVQRVRRRFCQEAIFWMRLRHKNIVPLLGADMTLFPVCLVSVWMEHGNISGFLRQNPSEDKLRLLLDVAAGLTYLHSESMVHGDLKCANILINDSRQACIGDFGLSAVIHDPDTIMTVTPSPNPHGTLRWTAPEILDPERFGLEHAIVTPETDVYSFAMVMWEVFSGHVPFEECRYDATAQWKILSGVRPERPLYATACGLSDLVWDVMQRCWDTDRTKRPPIDVVLRELEVARERFLFSMVELSSGNRQALLINTRREDTLRAVRQDGLAITPIGYRHAPVPGMATPPPDQPIRGHTSLVPRLQRMHLGEPAPHHPRRRPRFFVAMPTLTLPPGVLTQKGEPAVAEVAEMTARAVFTGTSPDGEAQGRASLRRLRRESSQGTFMEPRDNPSGTLRPSDTHPVHARVSAPIPFIRSPARSMGPIKCGVDTLANRGSSHSISTLPLYTHSPDQFTLSDMRTPQLSWRSTPATEPLDDVRWNTAVRARSFPGTKHEEASAETASTSVMRREMSGEVLPGSAKTHRNDSWVHEWGYVAAGW